MHWCNCRPENRHLLNTGMKNNIIVRNQEIVLDSIAGLSYAFVYCVPDKIDGYRPILVLYHGPVGNPYVLPYVSCQSGKDPLGRWPLGVRNGSASALSNITISFDVVYESD